MSLLFIILTTGKDSHEFVIVLERYLIQATVVNRRNFCRLILQMGDKRARKCFSLAYLIIDESSFRKFIFSKQLSGSTILVGGAWRSLVARVLWEH